MIATRLHVRLTTPLRAAVVTLCTIAMVVFGSVASADVAPSDLAVPAISSSSGEHAAHSGSKAAVSPMAEHAGSGLCEHPCDPELPCSSDCVASCGSAGASTVWAMTAGLEGSQAASRTRAPGAHDAGLPGGPTSPPQLPPPID